MTHRLLLLLLQFNARQVFASNNKTFGRRNNIIEQGTPVASYLLPVTFYLLPVTCCRLPSAVDSMRRVQVGQRASESISRQSTLAHSHTGVHLYR